MGNRIKTQSYILVFSAMGLIFSAGSFGKLKKVDKAAADQSTVWIMQPDGAKSCEPESGKSLDEGAKELKAAHIPISEARKGTDGKVHAQMCGAPQGTTNSYLIPRDRLKDAARVGFQVAP